METCTLDLKFLIIIDVRGNFLFKKHGFESNMYGYWQSCLFSGYLISRKTPDPRDKKSPGYSKIKNPEKIPNPMDKYPKDFA